jgi:hypothetical protein
MFAAVILEFWNTLYFSCRTSAFVIFILANDLCVCVCVFPPSPIFAVEVFVRYKLVEYHNLCICCNSASQVVLAPLINIALDVTEIRVHTGRDAPTVIT